MMSIDFINRYGSFLAGRSAERCIDAAVAVDHWIRNGMEAIGDQDADFAFIGRGADEHFAGGGAIGDTGDDERIGADDDRRG